MAGLRDFARNAASSTTRRYNANAAWRNTQRVAARQRSAQRARATVIAGRDVAKAGAVAAKDQLSVAPGGVIGGLALSGLAGYGAYRIGKNIASRVRNVRARMNSGRAASNAAKV